MQETRFLIILMRKNEFGKRINKMKSFFSKQQSWLCLPLSIAFIADVGLTLLGQSPEYWSGAYYDVNEGNTLSNWLLSIHPLAYTAIIIGCLAFVIYCVTIIPKSIGKFIITLCFLFHTVGTYCWLSYYFHIGYWESVIILIFFAAIFTFAYSKGEQNGILSEAT
jgi:hypothetical protein